MFDLVNETLNEIKVLCQPMRTGKTFESIKGGLPEARKQGKRWIIYTTPLTGIISQNEVLLQETCAENGTIYTNKPNDIIKHLNNGKTVASYVTNATCYVKWKNLDILSRVDISKVALIIDEMDYGSTSSSNNLEQNKAYKAKNFKGRMYGFASRIAKKSNFVVGLTATPSYEIKEFFPTSGKVRYNLIKPLVEGEQKKYANRVGWVDPNAYFYEIRREQSNHWNSTLQRYSDTKTHIESETLLMLKTAVNSATSIEKATNYKRSILIQVQDRDEVFNDEKIIECFKEQRYLHKPFLSFVKKDDWIGSCITSQGAFKFNLLGNTKDMNKSEIETLYDDLDDQNNPLRILLVKMMAGRGVTIKTLKEIITLKLGDTPSIHGEVTETPEQYIGRGKSPYTGEVSIPSLYKNYKGSIGNIPRELFSNHLINTYKYYAPQTDRHIEAWDKHLKFDACTVEMSDYDLSDIYELTKNGVLVENGKLSRISNYINKITQSSKNEVKKVTKKLNELFHIE